MAALRQELLFPTAVRQPHGSEFSSRQTAASGASDAGCSAVADTQWPLPLFPVSATSVFLVPAQMDQQLGNKRPLNRRWERALMLQHQRETSPSYLTKLSRPTCLDSRRRGAHAQQALHADDGSICTHHALPLCTHHGGHSARPPGEELLPRPSENNFKVT